mmetsp:Transcript_87361/g.265040  ORF Transcript_87361/g.265040 Transcript_87361/m.265040 type:complete len:263 (+) Transcript_87361:1091-1879(+)
MVADLKKQQAEEVRHKAFCGKELHDNEKMTYATGRELGEIADKLADLEATIEKLAEAIAAAKKEIVRTEVEVKKAGEARKAENQAFQEEVTDQRAIQAILKKAAARLELVYKKDSLLQAEPPASFQPYKQNAGAGGIVSLLEAIVEDSEVVEKDALAAENEAEKDYELVVQDAKESIRLLTTSVEEKGKAKSATEVEREEVLAHQKSTQEKLEDLEAAAVDLHAQCDFVLQNFDIRQKARTEELEALQGAMAFLSGMLEDTA